MSVSELNTITYWQETPKFYGNLMEVGMAIGRIRDGAYSPSRPRSHAPIPNCREKIPPFPSPAEI